MKSIFFIIPLFVFGACNNSGTSGILTPDQWHVAADSFGSSYSIEDVLIQNGVAEVSFTIAHKTENDPWHPWVELIYEPGHTLELYTGLTITYKNDTDLLIKLSQSNFGAEGNQTYSHYQYSLPAADEWKTTVVSFNSFTQPEWTPEISSEIPLILENVDAVYLVPDLDYNIGESTHLKVQSLDLQ